MHPATKKKKAARNQSGLWSLFDTEVGDGERQNMKCLYTKSQKGERIHCDLCQTKLNFDADRFLICPNKKCGIIYKDILDHSAEWRYYGAADSKTSNPTRCGIPVDPLLKVSSYGCKVICGSRSSYEMRKIRRYTEWQSMPYKEKSMYDEFQRIRTMARMSGLHNMLIDAALRYHAKISKQKTFRGLNRDGILAASIYIACRVHDYPRTPKEIATIFRLDNTSATRGCKNAVTILNKLEKDMINADKTHFHQMKPVDFIDRFCSRLSINKELTCVCTFIADRIDSNCLMPENTPHSVAAGIIYFIAQICSLNISKHDVYLVSEISEVTINKCFKKLEKRKEDLVPTPILLKYTCK